MVNALPDFHNENKMQDYVQKCVKPYQTAVKVKKVDA